SRFCRAARPSGGGGERRVRLCAARRSELDGGGERGGEFGARERGHGGVFFRAWAQARAGAVPGRRRFPIRSAAGGGDQRPVLERALRALARGGRPDDRGGPAPGGGDRGGAGGVPGVGARIR